MIPDDVPRCSDVYVTGYRRGEMCPYPGTNIIAFAGQPPQYVCGYHARAYAPNVVYPLEWSLARVRWLQRSNLDALLTETREDPS